MSSTSAVASILSKDKEKHLTTVLSIGSKEFQERDLDKGFKYAKEIENLVVDPELEAKMVRKIDFLLLPIIGLLMSCQLMDKTTNSYASIMGLFEDIPAFNTDLYSWVGTSFYFGILGFQFIADRLLTKFPISKTLGVFIIVWSIVLACHAACTNAASFLACRVLLGALESAMTPAYMIITSMWYTRNSKTRLRFKGNQQFIRTCIWFGSQGFGTILGSSIAYGLYTHRDSYSIPAWKLLYVVTATITFVLGVVSMVHIPDIPVKAWFLNETEKKYAVERSRQNQQGFGNTKFKKHQFIEAITDVRTYILMIYVFCYSMPNGGFQNFGSILYNRDFGFNTQTSLLMNMPGGAIDIVSPLVAIALSTFISSSLLVATCFNVLGVVGMCLLAFTEGRGSRLFGIYTFYLATPSISCFYAYISSNIAGSTKTITVHAIAILGYCAGNMASPQTFRTSDSPSYTPAKIAMIVSFSVATLSFLALYVLDDLENKRRDKKKQEQGDYELPENFEFADLTDKENPEFRYTL